MTRRRVVRYTLALAIVGLPALAGAGTGGGRLAAQEAARCQQCHGELELVRQHVRSLDEARRLLVPPSTVAASAHGGMACTECHSGVSRYPHQPATTTRTCAACHEQAAADWEIGAHAAAETGERVACADCHGVHDVADTASLHQAAGMAGMNDRCAACHEVQRLPDDDPHSAGTACFQCHAPHAVRPPGDVESWMSPRHQPEVCGTCHDSVATRWSGDVHGRALAEAAAGTVDLAPVGDLDPSTPPTCSTCHGAHPMADAAGRDFGVAAVDRCAACHEKAAETFFGSYHGKATSLGSSVSATCAQCHGAHGIEPASDPGSRVAPANLVETCGACHEHARPAFVLYDSHPDPLDRDRNPWIFYSFVFMNVLLVGVLGVFGLHTLLWWIRIRIDRRRGVSHQGGGGE